MRLLILTSRVPYPIEKGDKLRVYNFIKELSKYNDIYIFALDENNTSDDCIDHLKKYCKSIKILKISKKDIMINIMRGMFNGLPLQVNYYTSPYGINIFRKYVNEIKPDHIFCQLLRVTEYVKCLDIPKTIDIQDTMSVNFARSANKNIISNIFTNSIYKFESNRLKKYEYHLFNIFNNKIIISQPDKDLYPHPDRCNISIIPNGVDYSYFIPDNNVKKDIDVIFTGNMGYKPNIDGTFFLVNKIMPELKRSRPDIKIMIVGTNPPKKIRQLQSDNVTVTGWVNDIREYYSRAKVFIAPMRIGTGLQNKLLEAMSMKIPCITTPLANESLGATSNENILIGKDKYTLAKHILSLLDDINYANTIASNGYNFVHKHYNWDNAGKKLNSIMGGEQILDSI